MQTHTVEEEDDMIVTTFVAEPAPKKEEPKQEEPKKEPEEVKAVT